MWGGRRVSSAGHTLLLNMSALVFGELWLFFGDGVLDICACGRLLVWVNSLCGGGGCVWLNSGGSYAGGVEVAVVCSGGGGGSSRFESNSGWWKRRTMVGGGVNLAGGGVRDSVTSDITVIVVGGIPRVGVGVAACLVASKCSGLMVVRFRI